METEKKATEKNVELTTEKKLQERAYVPVYPDTCSHHKTGHDRFHRVIIPILDQRDHHRAGHHPRSSHRKRYPQKVERRRVTPISSFSPENHNPRHP